MATCGCVFSCVGVQVYLLIYSVQRVNLPFSAGQRRPVCGQTKGGDDAELQIPFSSPTWDPELQWHLLPPSPEFSWGFVSTISFINLPHQQVWALAFSRLRSHAQPPAPPAFKTGPDSFHCGCLLSFALAL